VRIRKGNQRCTFELIGLNGQAVIAELRLVPQPFSRIKRMVAKKLLRLHPAYERPSLKQQSFRQQWSDYNRLLSRTTFPLVGYDEWIERVEHPQILEEQQRSSSGTMAASANLDPVN
uniref:hypothetical protein n=1 Tax=Salmonella enterica TaxID=28901 RepID=UPI0035234319